MAPFLHDAIAYELYTTPTQLLSVCTILTCSRGEIFSVSLSAVCDVWVCERASTHDGPGSRKPVSVCSRDARAMSQGGEAEEPRFSLPRRESRHHPM
eukprot:2822030-Prymnesium_polylepis.1